MKKKTIGIILLFISIIGISFLIYYGFSNEAKTDIQNCKFYFVIAAECISFITTLLSNTELIKNEKKNTIIFISSAYLVLSILINILLGFMFTTIRVLIVTNAIAILLIFLAVSLELLSQKEN